MTKKNIIFHVLRYFNEPISEDLFNSGLNKLEKGKLIIASIFDERDFEFKGKSYAIRSIEQVHNVIHCKLGVLQKQHVYEKDEKEIIDKISETCPFLYIICDIEKQILYVEKKSHFPSFIKVSKILKELSLNHYSRVGYTLQIEPITKENVFWDICDSADSIFSVKFTLHSPNFFGVEEAADVVLRKMRERYNNTKTQIEISNDDGDLDLPKDHIDKFRNYADKGGGNWQVKTKVNNTKSTHKSNDYIRNIPINYSIWTSPAKTDTELRMFCHHFKLSRTLVA